MKTITITLDPSASLEDLATLASALDVMSTASGIVDQINVADTDVDDEKLTVMMNEWLVTHAKSERWVTDDESSVRAT